VLATGHWELLVNAVYQGFLRAHCDAGAFLGYGFGVDFGRSLGKYDFLLS